ncbi:MAG: YfhO family protein, partial [Lachnospiraceae bacterium]|nr:YfhO family protein [Lachnospiraceae bacterium]
YSLLSGAMAAVVLLPEIYALQSTASGDINFPKTLTSYFSIFDMIARHLTCVETEIGLDHWPNIYCGAAVLMFFLLYVVCKKISVKERAVYCGLLLIFFASFSTNVLNFIWHGFHYPNSLPSRQSFIYIFLMLFVCFRAFMYLEETPKKHINAAFLGSICFVLLAEKLIDAKHFHFSIFYVAIIVLSMYAGVLHMFKIGKRELAACLALILVSVEAAANTAVTSVTITSREAYTRDNEDVHMLMDMVEPSDDFYRVEKKTRKTKNDGAWMNFPSVSLFSSTANADLTEFFKRMGCEASTNSYSITGSTPLVDSLVSIKYALYSEEVPNTELWAYMKESGETYLYENLYTLPLGFVISHSVEDNWQFKMDNPGEVQNDLCQALGNDAVLQWIDSNTSGKNCTFTPDLDGYYYVYVTNKKVKSVKAAVPSGSKTFNNTDRGYLLELGSLVAGNQITLTSQTDGQDMKCEVYRFSDEAMISLYEKLNKTPLKLTSWEDTKLAGTVNAAERGVLFTSIPYETGWTVKIDGEVAETEKIFEAFLSVDIPEGEHEITFEYFPAGLKPGIIITLASIAILAMLFIVDRIMERRYQEKKAARKAAEALEAMNVEAEDETDAMEFEEELPAEDETDSEVSDLEKEEEKH